MDMIAEILQTDKAAAGKLEKADMESTQLLEQTVNCLLYTSDAADE